MGHAKRRGAGQEEFPSGTAGLKPVSKGVFGMSAQSRSDAMPITDQETGSGVSPLESGRILSEEQIQRIKEVLEQASASVVLDEDADGDGAVVATMSDGRHLITLALPLGGRIDPATAEADALLFCHARTVIYRLLQDREYLLEENDRLRQRIAELESLLREQLHKDDSLSAMRPR